MKSIFHSKTFWFGAAQILLAISESLRVFIETGDFSQNAIALFFIGLVTIILRTMTKDAVFIR